MYEFARCPRCNDAVRLPTQSSHWVRCPHCRSEYPVDQVLEQLPPELEVISAPSAVDGAGNSEFEAQRSAEGLVEVDSQFDESVDGAIIPGVQPRPQTIAESGSGVSLVTSNPSIVVNESKAHVRSPETLRAERRKAVARKQRAFSEQMGIVKVALGGVAGLMIGQLILWWLPKPYRTDPMKLAPQLPTPVAFLAPASLRGDVPTLTKDESFPTGIAPESDTPVPAPSTRATVEETPVVNSAADNESAGLHRLVLGQTDAPKFSVDELKEVLKAAREAEDAVDSPDGAALTRAWYAPLCELARCVTVADPKQPNVKAFARATKAFIGKLESQPRKLQSIARFAAVDISDSDYDRKGILLHGKVLEIEAAGSYFQSLVELENRPTPIAVISRTDPRTRSVYAVGDRVTVLGVIISDPRFYLIGYEGQAETVVFGGLPLRHK